MIKINLFKPKALFVTLPALNVVVWAGKREMESDISTKGAHLWHEWSFGGGFRVHPDKRCYYNTERDDKNHNEKEN